MKKILLITLSLVLVMTLGCSQKLNVTVYNTSGVWDNGQMWIAITLQWDGGNHNFYPTSYAPDERYADGTNSYSFSAKEGDTLIINANGQYYTVDSSGNTALADFNIAEDNAEAVRDQVLYGSFLDPADWYAAVYINEIVFYRK